MVIRVKPSYTCSMAFKNIFVGFSILLVFSGFLAKAQTPMSQGFDDAIKEFEAKVLPIKNSDELLSQLRLNLNKEDFGFIESKVKGLKPEKLEFKKVRTLEYSITAGNLTLPFKIERPDFKNNEMTFYLNRKPITYKNSDSIEDLWKKVENAVPKSSHHRSVFIESAHAAAPLVVWGVVAGTGAGSLALGVFINCSRFKIYETACESSLVESPEHFEDMAKFYLSFGGKNIQWCSKIREAVRSCLESRSHLLSEELRPYFDPAGQQKPKNKSYPN